jgi:hypothetical protein
MTVELLDMVTKVGFPIALNIYLIVVHSRETKELTRAINALVIHLKGSELV